jgi:hypothetical protein
MGWGRSVGAGVRSNGNGGVQRVAALPGLLQKGVACLTTCVTSSERDRQGFAPRPPPESLCSTPRAQCCSACEARPTTNEPTRSGEVVPGE